jgi:cobalt/nickel transport system ATP-binding protein
MVFQNPDDQVFSATVLQDVRYGPEQAGHDEATCARLAEVALQSVGLWTLRDRAPFSLSQGQRKRAAIAGVLAAGSEILLFDEPMASLDPAGKDEIQVLLNDLHATGKTLVVATHDVDFAAAWADGVILMGGGQVVAMGAPDLLVNESVMTLAGLALPLVSRPFELLRPHLKHGDLGLKRLPASIAEAYSWLRYHFVEKGASQAATGKDRVTAESSGRPPATKGSDY